MINFISHALNYEGGSYSPIGFLQCGIFKDMIGWVVTRARDGGGGVKGVDDVKRRRFGGENFQFVLACRVSKC
ncbi:hypothetical protein M5689_000367 [Euphorbia peplus]|nr:hypothetical protein M5689_000367 [Euphorbia peplus]